MIDSGQIDYALIVDGEGSRHTQEATLDRLASDETTDSRSLRGVRLADARLGCAPPWCLGRHSENPGSHRVLGGISQADTSHHKICVGTLDQMRTDTKALLDAGLAPRQDGVARGRRAGWLEMDRYIIHQVSAVHTSMMCDVLGIDPTKAPLTFPTLGNVGPASVPITLAEEVDSLAAGRPRAAAGHRVRHQRDGDRDPLVTSGVTAPATLPPPGLAGLDPAWSRLVTRSRSRRVGRTFHLLDNGVADRRAHAVVRARQPLLVVPVA